MLNLTLILQDSISNTATYFQQLLEGRNKEVAGSTYRELKELILRIVDNGYFDWKPEPEPEPVIEEPEPVVAAPEVVEPEPTPSVTRNFYLKGADFHKYALTFTCHVLRQCFS